MLHTEPIPSFDVLSFPRGGDTRLVAVDLSDNFRHSIQNSVPTVAFEHTSPSQHDIPNEHVMVVTDQPDTVEHALENGMGATWASTPEDLTRAFGLLANPSMPRLPWCLSRPIHLL